MGETISEQEIRDIIEEADVDSDGLIDYSEFYAIMMAKNQIFIHSLTGEFKYTTPCFALTIDFESFKTNNQFYSHRFPPIKATNELSKKTFQR